MPLTTLQRRWLKSLLTDKRLQLFDVDCSGLEDVEPLFSEEQFVYFDRYSDGDNYDAPQYKQHFRLLLQAITEKRRGKSDGYPFAAGMGKRESSAARGYGNCGQLHPLEPRYNTLDLASKVSVPRGCGPFGNPGGNPSLYALQFARINFIHFITQRIDIGLVMTGQYNCFSLSFQSKKQFPHFFYTVVIQSIKRFI